MTIQRIHGPEKVREASGRLEQHERSRLRAAALHARRLHPGSVGELLFRELNAYAEFGYRFSTDTLIPTLATEILAQPSPYAATA